MGRLIQEVPLQFGESVCTLKLGGHGVLLVQGGGIHFEIQAVRRCINK